MQRDPLFFCGNNVIPPSWTLILPGSWKESKTDLKEEVDGFQIVTLTPTSSLLSAPPSFPAPPPLVFSLAFQDGCRDQFTSEILSKKRVLCRLPMNSNISFVCSEFSLSFMQYKETLIFLWQEQDARVLQPGLLLVHTMIERRGNELIRLMMNKWKKNTTG